MSIKITVLQCPECHTWIFSRTNHDWRSCPCGLLFVDGGRQYLRFGLLKQVGEDFDYSSIKSKVLLFNVEIVKKFYPDWNYRRDQYGYIKDEDIEKYEELKE